MRVEIETDIAAGDHDMNHGTVAKSGWDMPDP